MEGKDQKKIEFEAEIQGNAAKEFDYFELLTDNSPQAYEEYKAEAAILNYQIKNPNVYNIAVVADNGAGKSSVINTYLNSYRNKKSLWQTICDFLRGTKHNHGNQAKNRYTKISLATFNKTDYDETAIERSILQQLLYSRQKSKLPNSRIERTNKTSWAKTLFISIIFVLFIFTTIFTGIDFVLYTENAGKISIFTLWWIKYLLLGISAVLFVFLLYILIYYKKLNRIKYKELEADINANEAHATQQVTNLINKFVDEVLYFFECINIDLVIFEDLDRLPTSEIFVKLRELNTIINNSRKKAKKVTFLYAVKNNLFKKVEERAKFFEFILPIVPVINPITTRNALENKLASLVKKNSKMKLTGKFLNGISFYIPDMRILKNTFNDYIVMYHKIFEDENASLTLENEKLFALCLYKNLFPHDYALLEKNDGLVPKVVDVLLLRNILSQKIQKEIEAQNKQIESLKSERINSFEELKAMFIGQITQMGYVNNYAKIDSKSITTFKNLDFSSIMHPSYRSNSYCVALPGGQTEILTPSGEHYIDKENKINARLNNGIEKAKIKLAELENQERLIQDKTFSDIVAEWGLDLCFPDNLDEWYLQKVGASLTERDKLVLDVLSSELVHTISKQQVDEISKAYKTFKTEIISEDQLKLQIEFLRFLVAQNYIDEHYMEYMSNFKAAILSAEDTKAVQSIQSHKLNFNLIIKNISNVLRWLNEDDFLYPSILIKSILSSLKLIKRLSESEKGKKFENILSLLSNKDDKYVLEKIQEYIISSDDDGCELLLEMVIPKRPSLCAELLNEDKLTSEKIDYVLVKHIKYSHDFKNQTDINIISEYISKHNDYLSLLNSVDDYDKVINFLSMAKPQFKQLVIGDGDIEKYIEKNNLYALTLINLASIYRQKIPTLGNSSSDLNMSGNRFFTGNYHFIMTSDKEDVKNYVSNHIETYIKNVLLDDRVSITAEPEEQIMHLIKNDDINIDLRKAIIAKCNLKFESLNGLNEDLYESIFDNDKVQLTWYNIQFAYEKKGFDCIKNTLKRNTNFSGGYVELEGIDKNTSVKLTNEILKLLTVEEVKKVCETQQAITRLSAIDISGISDENLAAFASEEKIWYDNSDLIKIYTMPLTLCVYLKVYEKDIFENFNAFFSAVLPGNNIAMSDANKIIAAIIACKGINVNMKMKLLDECYSIINISGNERIFAEYIINEHQPVSTNILWQFTTYRDNVTEDERKIILCRCVEKIDFINEKEKFKEYFKTLGKGWNAIFERATEIRVDQTSQNKELFSVLKEKNQIKFNKSRKPANQLIVKAI